MPLYFIDAHDGDFPHCDEEGIELPDDAAARHYALDALPDMARDRIPDGDQHTFTATARDACGNVVYVATLVLNGDRGPGWRS
ncbi:MAG: DUF6894 family protein [Janthinobacterium lividum]